MTLTSILSTDHALAILAVGLIALTYWHIPYSFYRWYRGRREEPAAGQVWAFARLSPLNDSYKWHTFQITKVELGVVYYISNWMELYEDEGFMSVDEWNKRMVQLRGWILEKAA